MWSFACKTVIAVSTKAAHGLAARALPLSKPAKASLPERAFVEELFARYFQPIFHTKLFPTSVAVIHLSRFDCAAYNPFAVEALHTVPSYASETAAWPLQNLRTLRAPCLSGLSFQLRTSPCKFPVAFPAVEALCTQFLLTLPRLPQRPPSAAASSGLSTLRFRGLQTLRNLAPPSSGLSSAVEPLHTALCCGSENIPGQLPALCTQPFLIRFRGCRLPPSKLPCSVLASSGLSFHLSNRLSSCRGRHTGLSYGSASPRWPPAPCSFQWPLLLSSPAISEWPVHLSLPQTPSNLRCSFQCLSLLVCAPVSYGSETAAPPKTLAPASSGLSSSFQWLSC